MRTHRLLILDTISCYSTNPKSFTIFVTIPYSKPKKALNSTKVPEMNKTLNDPIIESTAAARLATEKAIQTNELKDIDIAVSEWEKVVQVLPDDSISEDQADILASYADTITLRWKLTPQISDIGTVVSHLERALNQLPHSSNKARYDLLIRLATVHEIWYLNSKYNSLSLKKSIQYWEDAYGLAVVLRRTKEAV
jgi:hypothetical protein